MKMFLTIANFQIVNLLKNQLAKNTNYGLLIILMYGLTF